MKNLRSVAIKCLLAVMCSSVIGMLEKKVQTLKGGENCCASEDCSEFTGNISVTEKGEECAPWSWKQKKTKASSTSVEIDWEQGSAGASSQYDSDHNANRAFQSAQSVHTAPWANAESDKFPVMVWNRLPDKVRVASLSFSSRSQSKNLDQSPTDFELVGSDNCDDWTSISSFQTQFTKVSEVQSWDVAVDERKAFRCVGIKVNKVGSGRFAAIQGLKMYAESVTTCNVAVKGGKASASTTYPGSSTAASAFNGKKWHSGNGVPQWLMYELKDPLPICKISFFPRSDRHAQSDTPKSYKFEGSYDGITFETIFSLDDQVGSPGTIMTKSFANKNFFKFYRLMFLEVPGRSNGNKFVVLVDVNFFGNPGTDLDLASEDWSTRFCRNPGPNRDSRPWCYNLNNTKEFCNVPKCGDALIDPSRPELLLPTIESDLGEDVSEAKVSAIFANEASDSKCPRNDLYNDFLGYLIDAESFIDDVAKTTGTFKEIIEAMQNPVVELQRKAVLEIVCQERLELSLEEVKDAVEEAKTAANEIEALSQNVTESNERANEEVQKIIDHNEERDKAFEGKLKMMLKHRR